MSVVPFVPLTMNKSQVTAVPVDFQDFIGKLRRLRPVSEEATSLLHNFYRESRNRQRFLNDVLATVTTRTRLDHVVLLAREVGEDLTCAGLLQLLRAHTPRLATA